MNSASLCSPARAYHAMRAFARAFMAGDTYDRIVCCKFLSLWFSVVDSADPGAKGYALKAKSNQLGLRKKF